MRIVAGAIVLASLVVLAPVVLAQGGATSSITGRYFAPANSLDCIQLKAGDCADRNVVLLAPWFTPFDIGLTKKVRMGSKSLEFRADVLNAFNNINFTVTDSSRPPGSGAGIFQTLDAYRDLDNTYDPGGRLGQLAIRFNW